MYAVSPLQSQIYMMEQEKRRMELEVGCLNLQKQKSDEIVTGLQFKIGEEKRKRKKERKRKVCCGYGDMYVCSAGVGWVGSGWLG